MDIAMTSSKNNSYCGLAYYDGGYAQEVFVNLGESAFVGLRPVKYIYVQENEKCRSKPYNQIIYEKISEDLKVDCNSTCRLPNRFLYDFYMKH